MAFVRHALGTHGPRHLSMTSSSTDLKSADGDVVGVQVPLPPSLETPAATEFWQGAGGRGGFGFGTV